MRWRIWYDGGRFFDSESMSWEELPEDGVQLVVVYLPKGQRHISGCDFYFKADGDILGGNSDSEVSIRRRYSGAVIKRGRWTSDEEIGRIKQEARS